MHRVFYAIVCALTLGLGSLAGAHHSTSSNVGQFGAVQFQNSCAAKVQPALQSAIAHLHSFDWAAPLFVEVATNDPNCAVAWWGAAMSVRGNPLAGVLGEESLKTGRNYMDRALGVESTARERGLIEALSRYFQPNAGGHVERARAYEAAMQSVYEVYPEDVEVAAFYALSILEAVDLNDKTYVRQIKAGAVLEDLLAREPDHPGAPHYLIHAYDYASLAERALAAARKYAALLPASPHARHMPAHIFTMLGLWNESITANEHSATLIDPTAKNLDIVDDHGFDFIAYARLQLSQDIKVQNGLAALRVAGSSPVLVEARYALERGDWQAAMAIPVPNDDPLNETTARFARALGAARSGRAGLAQTEWQEFAALRSRVAAESGDYWAALVDIYSRTAAAWIAKAQGRGDEARAIMQEAAARDDAREKHIWLENKLVPMRELFGEMLLDLNQPADATRAFTQSLAASPNRFRSYAGAARAARTIGDIDMAREWYGKLVALSAQADTERPELAEARAYLVRR